MIASWKPRHQIKLKKFKALTGKLVKDLIKQNKLKNKKITQGLDSLKILKSVDQTSLDQTLLDTSQILNAFKTPDTSQILNAFKTPDTTDKETLPESPLLLNGRLTPDTKIKQTTSSSSFFLE